MYSSTEQPFYLQGSQTGSILQDASNYGSADTAYLLGSGMPLYSGTSGGTLSTYSSPLDPNALYSQWISAGQPGSFENYFAKAQDAAAATRTSSQDGWMSPEEMRDATNSLSSISRTPSAGGGSSYGGTSGGVGGSTASGLNLGAYSPSSTTSSSSPSSVNLPGFPTSTSNVGYTAPDGSVQSLPPGSGVLNMQQANPQNQMAQYQNTLGYQLLGNDQTNQYRQSPGYQYAVNEALQQVQQNAAARGLLESGAALRGMTDRAVGMAQQDYSNWWNRQNQLYSDYQNRLAGLAGGPTGSQNAMTLGQGLAQNSAQTGSNLGSLFANQGSTGMGGIINTGAAQSSNMTNAGAQQAMINQANQSTQLAGATLGMNNGLF